MKNAEYDIKSHLLIHASKNEKMRWPLACKIVATISASGRSEGQKCQNQEPTADSADTRCVDVLVLVVCSER